VALEIPSPVRGVVQTSKGEVPAWLPPRPEGGYFGYHCDERMIAVGYEPDGNLFFAQCTERGKEIWPAKKPEAPHIGRYDHGRVYFIQASTGHIKIGYAQDVEARLKTLQVAHPTPLLVLAVSGGGMPQERKYHTRFADHRLLGEWFAPHPDILAEIDRLRSLPTGGDDGTV